MSDNPIFSEPIWAIVELFGRNVIAGEVSGNAHAAERVEIAPSGRLIGNISAPRITIADGAHFKGTVDMERSGEPAPIGSIRHLAPAASEYNWAATT